MGIGDVQPVPASQQKTGSDGNPTIIVTKARSLCVIRKQNLKLRLCFKRDEFMRLMSRPLNVYLLIQDKVADIKVKLVELKSTI